MIGESGLVFVLAASLVAAGEREGKRIESLRALTGRGVLYLTQPSDVRSPNLFYLTGRIERGAELVLRLEPNAQPTTGGDLVDALAASSQKVLWVEKPKDVPSHLAARFPGLVVEDVSPILAQLRVVKDDEEIARVRRACEITCQVLRETMAYVRPGMTEKEVSRFIAERHVALGADSSAFSLVQSGPSSTMPHGLGERDVLRAGTEAICDVGCVVRGYESDVTRTIPVSTGFTPREEEVYRALLAVQKKVEQAVRPGISLRKLHELSERLVDEAGFAPYYTHFLGHFLGIEGHDVGDIDRPLAPGMLLTNEPGIYLPHEEIGFRIEDVLLVTASGCECLSASAPREVEEILRLRLENVGGVARSAFVPRFERAGDGLASKGVSSLAGRPGGPIFAGTFFEGLFRSDDDGRTFARSDSGIENPRIWSLALDPTRPERVWAGTHRRFAIYRSDDSGRTWTAAGGEQLRKQSYVKSVVVDPVRPDTVYLGVLWDGVIRSDDAGKKWEVTRRGVANLEVNALVMDPRDSARLVAGTFWDGVFATEDGGKSWKPAGLDRHYVSSLLFDPSRPERLFAGTEVGVYRRSGGGGGRGDESDATWRCLPLPASRVECLAIVGGWLVVGTYDDGLYASPDSGESFESWGNPGGDAHVTSLLGIEDRLFVGTSRSGLFGAKLPDPSKTSNQPARKEYNSK